MSPSIPPFPYLACRAVNLTKDLLPAKEWLTKIPGNEATANAYYDSIGARPAKNTFAKWRNLNGFTAEDDQNEVVFYNPNELCLGRRVNCRASSPGGLAVHTACYVTKYGHVGGSPLDAAEHHLAELAHEVTLGEPALADALNDVTRFDEGRGARIDEQAALRDELGRHLALIRATGADGHNVGAAGDPAAIQNR